MSELNISEIQREVKSGSLLQEIEKRLINKIGGESRYYKDKSIEGSSVILSINGIKENVDCKYVRDTIIDCLPLFNLEQEERIDDTKNEDIIFLKEGGDIAIAGVDSGLFLFISVSNL